MSALSVVEVLRKARDLVARPGGWTQNSYGSYPDGAPRCASGALVAAGGDLFDAHYRFLQEALDLGRHGAISTWNDAPGRTQAEVVALYDRAILLAEAAQ